MIAAARAEPWLFLGLPILLVLAGAAATGVLHRFEPQRPVTAALCGAVMGVIAATGVIPALIRDGEAERLGGPLGFLWARSDLFAGGCRRRALWAGSVVAIFLAPCLFWAWRWSLALFALVAAAVAFAGAAALLIAWRDLRLGGVFAAGPARHRPVPAWAVIAGRQARIGVPVALLACGLGALAAHRGLQAQDRGFALLATFIAALSAGLAWTRVDAALLDLLGRSRLGLGRLCRRHAWGPLAASAAVGALIALGTSDRSLHAPVLPAAVLSGAVAILRVVIGLGRTPAQAMTHTAVELGLIGLIAAVAPPLAAAWFAVRGAWLWRAAEQRRWRES